ncbi:MAG: GNAT family N-acetyltransferase [Fusobacteriaceae bacterium]|nr:GNAT family N-acetyltransferase [Fusobacteriaceae bacterium]
MKKSERNEEGKMKLRPFTDKDIPLFKKWLAKPHVAKWYERPGDWIHEINNRHGEFGFITHLIAEVDGAAIGFGQFYDMFYGQRYEDCRKIEAPGESFCIDYLIGEPKYLRKGYGKELVSLLTKQAFACGARRVFGQADPGNIASRKALEANGYVSDGEDYVKEEKICQQKNKSQQACTVMSSGTP